MSECVAVVDVGYACSRRGMPSAKTFRHWANAAMAAQDHRGALALRLVESEEGRALNRSFRGRDYATNVLSFPAPQNPAGWLGDIVICAPVIAREAQEQGKTARAHFAHMLVHGVLHLLGFDHETSADAERMERQEVSILANLGFADPYA